MNKLLSTRKYLLLTLIPLMGLGLTLSFNTLVKAQRTEKLEPVAQPTLDEVFVNVDDSRLSTGLNEETTDYASDATGDEGRKPAKAQSSTVSTVEEIADVPGATDTWWAGVQAQLHRESYRLSPDQAGQRGYNRAHNFFITLGTTGLRLSSNNDNEGNQAIDTFSLAGEQSPAYEEPDREAWSWELRLMGYGYAGDIHPVDQPLQGTARGNRFEYLYQSEIVEWYINDERGLEHGFTLPAPPPRNSVQNLPAGQFKVDNSKMTINLALDTTLTPQLSPDQQSIDFLSPGRVTLLRYSELHVSDAAGRQLPAYFELGRTSDSSYPNSMQSPRVGEFTIRIVMDDGDAVYPLTIDPMASSPGWTSTGENNNDEFGYSVASAGDVNGDGYADAVVGAHGYPNGDYQGAAYVYHGSAAGLGATAALTLIGENDDDFFGVSVASVGDVNKDGYADAIVGAYGYPGGSFKGRTYVYHGSEAGLAATPVLTLTGEYNDDQFGVSVASAGDVNGDGYVDAIVGAPGYRNFGLKGRVYVYHGSGGGLGATPALTLTGENNADEFGRSVASAGDVNGDGYADTIVGATNAGGSTQGLAYVYHGSALGLAATPALTLTGENFDDKFGSSVASVGDVNGDGYADAIVGASGYPGLDYKGRAYVYHGSAGGLGATPALTITGESDGDKFGFSVASAGDVNGDGYADAIVGAHCYSTCRGRATVYYGSGAGLGATPVLTLTGEADGDYLGISVASAGDVNGDGYADAIVGAYGYGSIQGRAYVYHGSSAGLGANPTITLTGDNDGDYFGISVASAGDVNGDGYADAIVGAYGYPIGNWKGRAYVYYGSGGGLAATPALTLTGKNNGDRFGYSVASAGDLNGDGYADAIVGAYGYPSSSHKGATYVYHGSWAGLGTTPALTLTGEADGDRFGYSVASGGDVNGDGYTDAIVGAYAYGSDQGRVYVYHGSGVGLASTPAISLTGKYNNDHFGRSVATAGDVNGDGYADAIAGARGYPSGGNKGAAYIYHGSGAGLGASPALTLTGENNNDYFGNSVASAGDLNGDGYADALVGAYGYPSGSFKGRAYVYHGSAAGLGATPAFSLTGETDGNTFGISVASLGDVNGDGYADAIVGANGYSSKGQAYIYHGNDGGGRSVLVSQLRGDGSETAVQPWGHSHDRNAFQIKMTATSPRGRERVKLEAEACAAGNAFGDVGCQVYSSTIWTDVTPTNSGVVLTVPVTSLTANSLYRWRARALYAPYSVDQAGIIAPLNPAHGPWRRLNGQAVEADVRTSPVPNLVIIKNASPADGTDFEFTWTNGTFTLDDAIPDDSDGITTTRVFTNLQPGTYTITEAGLNIWDLTNLTCQESMIENSVVDPGNATVTLEVEAGEEITCTFENTKRGIITIVKDAIPDDAQDFDFRIFSEFNPSGTSFRLDDDDDITLRHSKYFVIAQNSLYTITEYYVNNWDLTNLTCEESITQNSVVDLGNALVIVEVEPGEEITCTFENALDQHLLTVATEGSGSVTSTPSGVDCPGDCTHQYDYDKVVTLSASADAGSSFSGWSGACTNETGDCVVTMTGVKSVTAAFTLNKYKLTVATNGSGSVTSAPAGIDCPGDCTQWYDYDTEVTLSASADAGSSFSGWSGACTNESGDCVVTMDAAKSVTATFNLDQLLTVATTGSGSVTSTPAGIDCPGDCTQWYDYETVVTLTASADTRYSFTGWSGACTNESGDCVVTMDAAKSVTATFKRYFIYMPIISR